MKTKIIAGAAAAVLAAVAAYFIFLRSDVPVAASRDALVYAKAVQASDFDTVFAYNATMQKKRFIAGRGGDSGAVAALVAEEKVNFAQPLQAVDFNAIWVERLIFTQGASFAVSGVTLVEDTDNPSQPGTSRVKAVVAIKVSYPNKDSAPEISGVRVKGAVYSLTMVSSRNVSRLQRGETSGKETWLFKNILFDEKTAERW